MIGARELQTATLLANGQILVAGGVVGNRGVTTNGTETYDSSAGAYATIGSLTSQRAFHTATLLPGGKVLIAGGYDNGGDTLASVEIYDPVSGSRTGTGSLNTPRLSATATLLPNGEVLVAGGLTLTFIVVPETITLTNLSSAELYNPTNGTWQATGSLTNARIAHTATLLANGKVLVVGGATVNDNLAINNIYASAELYDPVTGIWSETGSLNFNRYGHSAILLPSGKVLVAGGDSGGNTLSSAELYDPDTGAWSLTGGMNASHEGQAAILLPSGKVLVTPGTNPNVPTILPGELYDPATETWELVAQMNSASGDYNNLLGESGDVAVLLPGGKVFAPFAAQVYDPAAGTLTSTVPMTNDQSGGAALLLPNGKVLLSGGESGFSQELYDPGLGFSNSWQPQITSATSPLDVGTSLSMTGSKFRGIAEGSSGNGAQDSAADYPVVQLRAMEGGRTVYLTASNWQTNSYTSMPVTNFPPGWAMVTVFVNGIQSTSSIVRIAPSTSAIVLKNPTKLGNGSLQFTFTNTPGAVFTVLETTNVATPAINWSVLGAPTEILDGVFQFNDAGAAGSPRHFYRVSSP